jgi:hypothetical protein
MYCNFVQNCRKIPLSGKIGGAPPILPLRGGQGKKYGTENHIYIYKFR